MLDGISVVPRAWMRYVSADEATICTQAQRETDVTCGSACRCPSRAAAKGAIVYCGECGRPRRA